MVLMEGMALIRSVGSKRSNHPNRSRSHIAERSGATRATRNLSSADLSVVNHKGEQG